MDYEWLTDKNKNIFLTNVSIDGMLVRAGFGYFCRYLSDKVPVVLYTPQGDTIRVHLEQKHSNLARDTISIPTIMSIVSDGNNL